MDTRGWERAKELYYQALDLAPEAQERLLEDAAPEIRAEVRELLEANARASGREDAAEARTEGPGTVIDRYRLLQVIGEGGFGVVYMAEQREPVQRKVALKIIKLGMDTKQVVARFEAERQALAIMDHPNIAKVLDAGSTQTGRPYFVMELVKGIPITTYCDKAALDTRSRLRLFADVCRAVQHAHQKGIIHRDLKPTNVLVTLHDGKPVPKVIDFGIAKATDRRLTDRTLYTEFRQVVGTPEYMAPEQAELSNLDVDTRADVYSLGVLLYELLTGSKPFELTTLLEQGWNEILRTIREVDPPKPSTRLSTLGEDLVLIARNRQVPPKLLGRLVRGDLDWIVMKAIEKDRSRRYDSADAIALDVERYLADEPVLATPPTPIYRIRKYVRRHKVAVLAGTIAAVALFSGLGFAVFGLRRAIVERDAARSAKAAEADARREAVSSALRAHRERDDKEEARAHLAEALRESEGVRLTAQSRAVLPEDPTLALLLAIEGAKRRPGVFANHALFQALEEAPRSETILPFDDVRDADFGPRGERVVTAHDDGTVRIWDERGEALLELRGHAASVTSVCWSRSTGRIVTGSYDGTLRVWDGATGEVERVLRTDHYAGPWSPKVAVSADARRAVTAGAHGLLSVWDLASGSCERTFTIQRSDRLFQVAYVLGALHPDGETFVVSQPSGTGRAIEVWDLSTGEKRHEWAGGKVSVSPRFAPEGGGLLFVDPDGQVTLGDTSTGARVRQYTGHQEKIRGLAFTPDGTRIFTGTTRGRLFRAETGDLEREFGPKDAPLYFRRPAVRPQGDLLATLGHSDGRVRLWDLRTAEARGALPSGFGILRGRFCPRGRRLLVIADDAVRVWDPIRGRDRSRLWGKARSLHPGPGRRLVIDRALFSDWPPRLFDLAACRPVSALCGYGILLDGIPKQGNSAVAVAPDGTRVATAGTHDFSIVVWEGTSGHRLRAWYAHAAPIWSLAFSPDGRKLLSAGQDEIAVVWDAATGERLLTLGEARPFWGAGTAMMHLDGRLAVWSPDGSRILTMLGGRAFQLWDAATGEHLHALDGGHGAGQGGTFTPDGRTVVTTEIDESSGIVKRASIFLWDTESGTCRYTLDGHGSVRAERSLSPDGADLLAFVPGEGLRVHDVSTGERLRVLAAPVKHLGWWSWSPDGRFVAAETGRKRLLVWDAASGSPWLDLEGSGSNIGVGVFTPDSKHVIVIRDKVPRLIPLDLLAAAERARPRALTAREREVYVPGDPCDGPLPAAEGPECQVDHHEAEERRLLGELHALAPGVGLEGELLGLAERVVVDVYRGLGLADEALVETLEVLAAEKRRRDDLGGAVRVLAHLYPLAVRRLGAGHARTHYVEDRWIEARLEHGDAGVESRIRTRLEAWRARHGVWRLHRHYLHLGRCLLDAGRYEEAERTLAEGLEIAERAGDLGWRRGVMACLQGEALTHLGRYADAEETLLEGHSVLKPVLGARGPDPALQARHPEWGPYVWLCVRTRRAEGRALEQRVLKSLARLYEAWDEPEEARRWRDRVRELAEGDE